MSNERDDIYFFNLKNGLKNNFIIIKFGPKFGFTIWFLRIQRINSLEFFHSL